MLAAIRACRHCVEAPQGKPLPHEPRPVLRASSTARLAVCSQAPGTKVHASGTPFTDRSGDRLRDWMGVTPQEFYDESARSPSCRWGSAFPDRTRRAPICRRGANARALWHRRAVRGAAAARARAGGRALTRKIGISARRLGRTLQETMLGLAAASQAQGGARACCRCRTRPGATMAGSSDNPWFEQRASAGAAPRGEEAALKIFRLRAGEK